MIDADKCRITHFPAEVLARKAKPIEQIDDNISRLVSKMIDIMIENKGVGLAAPQVGVSLRLFIISLNGTRENVRVYVNPTVTPAGEVDATEEGCLSVPGIFTKIRRFKKCAVSATDLEGNQFSEEAEGFYARALQHEYDHLEGATIVSRMSQTARIMHRKQLKRLAGQQEKGK